MARVIDDKGDRLVRQHPVLLNLMRAEVKPLRDALRDALRVRGMFPQHGAAREVAADRHVTNILHELCNYLDKLRVGPSGGGY